MALIFLRHTTPRVGAGVCYGRTDLALADSFQEEAAEIAAEIPPVARIVSSPLLRCRHLAEFLCDRKGLSVQIDPRLTEMDFGAWEGRLWSDIPKAELDAWANDFLHARPHGGESVAMLRERVRKAKCEFLSYNERMLIITHAGVIKAAFAHGDKAEHFETTVGFGSSMTLSPKKGDIT